MLDAQVNGAINTIGETTQCPLDACTRVVTRRSGSVQRHSQSYGARGSGCRGIHVARSLSAQLFANYVCGEAPKNADDMR